ncbi:MAG: response regulator [Planctomycetota bacterium]|nr:MAG: response regulator [Planctomycetota bacterium]
MDGVLQQVSGFAIWGSFASTVVLGAFLLVQAVVDPARRWKFGLFSAAMWFLASLDFLRSLGSLPPAPYEMLRLVWCGAYAGSVVLLFGYPARAAAAAAAALPAFGFAIYFGIRPEIATTAAYPLAFGLVATVHARKYLKDRGYASALLAGSSACVAAMCALYYTTISTGSPTAAWLGYAHYAQVSILSVFLGWVHLPREIRGRAPVKMSLPTACSYFWAMIVGEIVIQLGILVHLTPTPWLYLVGEAFQVMVMLAYYFAHRHQLVIHADNVSQLLEERTVELRAAQAELARQNDRLAERLAEQERDLRAKTEVIDRQRRLELAAQTAGQVAHDIQNMISPILSRIEELEEISAAPDIREKCTGMRKQVVQLLDLNTHLLALSRRGRVELQPVYLSEVVRDVAERFPGQRITLEPGGEAWLKGSASQLSRALSNLLTNAIECDLDRAVPVTVRWGVAELTQSKRCHLGFLAPGRYATLEVEDRGPGIPKEHVDKIFEPFFSSKGGKHRSGSGLGLTIVTAVMDDHKGVLDLETGSQGTRFTLYFPAIDPHPEASPLEKLSHSATVLVVDDDNSALKDYGDLLKQAGYTVLFAEGGPQAIRTVQAQPVDVILLDFNMPRMNGLETFFGAMHVRPGVRAVVHSSYVTDDQGARLRTLGVSTILTKPAGRLELLKALRQALEEGQAALAQRRPRAS